MNTLQGNRASAAFNMWDEEHIESHNKLVMVYKQFYSIFRLTTPLTMLMYIVRCNCFLFLQLLQHRTLFLWVLRLNLCIVHFCRFCHCRRAGKHCQSENNSGDLRCGYKQVNTAFDSRLSRETQARDKTFGNAYMPLVCSFAVNNERFRDFPLRQNQSVQALTLFPRN